MKCFAEIDYQRFVDDEVAPEERRQITVHLRGCAQCQGVIRRIEAENTRIREAFEIDGEIPALESPVMEKITAPFRHSLLRWALPTAAAFLLAAFLYFYFFAGGSRGPNEGVGEPRILIRSARVEGAPTRIHIYDSKDPRAKFIWLEKINGEEGSHEKTM